jgi:hypothetical protein
MAAAVAVVLSGCLLDLYGGDPRVQIKNTSAFQVRAVGIGAASDPTWKHDLDPVLLSGRSSEVIDLPAAGRLRLWVRVADSTAAWDTVLVDELSVGVGDFRLLEVSGGVREKLSTKH